MNDEKLEVAEEAIEESREKTRELLAEEAPK